MADDATRTQPPEPDGFTRTFTGAGATASFSEQATSGLGSARPEIPGYDLEQIVGRGGMGLVYRGRQLSTNRTVAVKLMIAGELAGESARARFRLEAENTAKLSHPNIVQLYEAGEAGGRAFFSCEFMAGGSLANKLDGTPWDGVRAAGMVVDLARAVAAAHAAGIVHRDLKPANVLLSADGSPKVADFGIAKSLDSDSHTNTGAILGTPSYMPPEQAGGAKAVGPAADVYSLGAILYELVAGRPPFRGADFVETIDQVRNQEPVPPRALNPKLPRDVETIALKCLQKDPAKRYATALALADDLERFLAGRPIAARPVGGFERAWRWAKRSPAIASLLALTFVLFAAGTAVSAYFAIQANAAREKAESREWDANRARNEADARAAELLVEREKADHLLYISQMNHAQIAYRDQSTARLSELLDLTRPDPGKTDYRNWEWHFLHRQTYSWNAEMMPDVAALPKSKAPRSAWSGIAGFGGGGQYHDLPFLTTDGTRIAAPPATSPFVVGLASLEDGGTFDAKTGKLIAAYRPLDADSSQALGASADGRFVVLREVKTNREGLPAEFVCRVVDRVSGTDLMPPRRGKLPMIPNVNADGTRVMIAYANYEGPGGAKPKSVPIEVWEPGTGLRKLEMPIPDGLHADVPIFGPSGRIALMPCGPSPKEGPLAAVRTTLVVQDLTTTPKAIRTITLPASMQSARFSPSGTCFMIHAPPEILVHSSATGEKLGSWTASSMKWPATVSDDGRTVVLTGNGSIIHVARNVVDSQWRVSTLRGPSAYSHPNSLGTYWCSPDGSELVAVRMDGKLYRWNLRSPPGYSTAWPATLRTGGAERYAVPSRFGERVLFHPYSADRVTGRISLGLHDPVAGSTRWAEAPDTVNYESIVHVHPDGSRIVSQSTSKKDEPRWEIRSLEAAEPDRLAVKVVAGGALPPDLSVRTSFSGAWLIEPLADDGPSRGHGIVPGFRIRDGTDGAVKMTVPPGAGLSYLPTIDPSDRFAVDLRAAVPEGGSNRSPVTLRVFDIAAGKKAWDWKLPAPITVITGRTKSPEYSPAMPDVAFSPDGSKLALAVRQTNDDLLRVRVFDSASGTLLREVVEPRDGPVVSYTTSIIAFDSVGRIAVGDGRNAVVWNATDPAPKRLIGHEGTPFSAVFSRNGTRLFTLDYDRSGVNSGRLIRVWDLATGKDVIAIREPEASGPGMQSTFSESMWLDVDKLKLMTRDGILVFDGSPR